MAAKQTIQVVLEKHPAMDATGITIPFDVEKVFGAKRVPVKAEINRAVYHRSIVRMDGKYLLGISKAFRETAGIAAGDNIVVTWNLTAILGPSKSRPISLKRLKNAGSQVSGKL